MDASARVPFPPDPNPRKPKLRAPKGSWDTHFHVYEPHLFPYVAERRYTPPAAPIEHWLAVADVLGIERGVVVQPNVHGADTRPTLRAIERGEGRLRGVVRDDPGLDAVEMRRLDRAGVRGMRFASVAALGARFDLAYFEEMVARARDLDWVIDLHVEEASLLAMADAIGKRPLPVVIDAWGRLDARKGLDQPALKTLVDLLRTGRVYVKFAAPNRFPGWGIPMDKLIETSRHLVAAAPDQIFWGTDWPHSDVFAPGKMPNDGDLLDALLEFAPDEAHREKILVANPARLFAR